MKRIVYVASTRGKFNLSTNERRRIVITFITLAINKNNHFYPVGLTSEMKFIQFDAGTLLSRTYYYMAFTDLRTDKSLIKRGMLLEVPSQKHSLKRS
jgi:hypothetical protein